jgi:D-aminoacyl-tRNA deacylase
MRAVVQRITSGSVAVAGERGSAPFISGNIERGLLVYAAAAPDDGAADLEYIADKVAGLRIFPDARGRMNLDVQQASGSVLLVSAFTVLADARKGKRPSFDAAADGALAAPLVESLVDALRGRGLHVKTGKFAAYMQVKAINDGPICILLDSRRLF